MLLGSRLKNIRESKNLSIGKVAEILELSPEDINSWESGESEPTVDETIKLGEIYNVSLDYLILGKNNSDLFFKALVLIMATASIGVLIFIFTILIFNVLKK